MRAVIPRTGSGKVMQLDEMSYVDPNVPCGQPRVAKWIFVGYIPEGQDKPRIFGWTPKKMVEGGPRVCP